MEFVLAGRNTQTANQLTDGRSQRAEQSITISHGDGHLFRPDHFAGHSLVACPFADNSFPHVYLGLLASLLPPSTRQPGPVAVLRRGKFGFIFDICLFILFPTLIVS